MACITESVSRFFEPSQPQRVPPGLETNVNPSPTYGGIPTKSRRTSVSVSNIGRPCDLELSFWYIKVLMNSYHHLKLDIYQRSPITQLRVYYVQISVLTHRCEACASCWRTHLFSNRDDRQRVRKQCEVQKAKPPLPNQTPIRNPDWFKSHFRKLYSDADWLKIHFLSPLSLHFS